MGLDITAYETVTLIQPNDEAHEAQLQHDWEYGENNVIRLYKHPHFQSVFDDLTEGYYKVDGKKFGFRAGSYSGYNWWREELARMIGTTPDAVWANPKPGPFVELINFSDCDGVIGPTTSAKLAEDFKQHTRKAKSFSANVSDGDFWLQLYGKWHEAFEIAANTGCVDFR